MTPVFEIAATGDGAEFPASGAASDPPGAAPTFDAQIALASRAFHLFGGDPDGCEP